MDDGDFELLQSHLEAIDLIERQDGEIQATYNEMDNRLNNDTKHVE